MARLLHRLGLLCARRPLIVLGIWFVMLVLIIGAVRVVGSVTSNDLSLPGTGSQEAKDLLQEKFPPQQNGANPIVFNITSGALTDSEYQQAINDSVKAIAKQPHVYSVTNPLSSSGQTAGLLSQDKQTAFAPVLMDVASSDLTTEIAQNVMDATDPAQKAGVQVAAAGSIGSTLSTDASETSEIIGILVAMLIHSLVLGSLVSMGMPILTAVLGLGAALALVGLAGHAVSIPTSGPTLATMIGLGVGIDYALFLVTRHQEQLRDGMAMDDSIANAVATSGSAIVFAGGTVVIALLSLAVAGIPLVTALGLASAIAVVTAVLGAITLLPALLGLLAHRIHWARLPAFIAPRPKKDEGMWRRWAGVVRRHPDHQRGLGGLPDPAGDPGVLPRARAGGHRCDQPVDHGTAGLRPDHGRLRGRLQRPAPGRLVDEPAGGSQRGVHQEVRPGPGPEEGARPGAEGAAEAAEAPRAAAEGAGAAASGPGEAEEPARVRAGVADRAGNELKAQQAALEKQGAALEAQKAKLQAQQRKLEREQAALKRQAKALAKKIKPLVRRLAVLEAHQKVLEKRIAESQDDPVRLARLEARLDRVKARETEVRQQLAPLEKKAKKLAHQAQMLQSQAAALQRQANRLQAQAQRLNRQKASLESQAAELQRRADALQAQGDQLKQQADELQAQGDQLQAQANELKAEQKQAEQEQQQAIALQDQLTNMLTAAGGDDRGTDPRVVDLQHALLATKGVVSLTPPQINKAGSVVLLSAVPKTSPASDATASLVTEVRDTVLPPVSPKGMTSYVGGDTASYVDLAALITARLLLVIGVVILLVFLLLMIAFRSLLIPLQAAITNLLSAAASFDVLTACFQWGWGISLGRDRHP